MKNNQLPSDVQERIQNDADKFSYMGLFNGKPLRNDDKLKGYIAGATAEAEKAQKQIRNLLDVLDKIVHAPVPASEREYMSWFVTAKNIAGGAISEYEAEIEAQQWKEGKGSEPVKEIEYMPILSAELSELKAIANVPLRVPMHLLNEDQAQSNHGQSLQRLKERGGLSIRESLSLITRQHWRHYSYLDNNKAVIMLNELITNPPK